MLGTLRQHSKSFIIYLLFAMIIIVFVFTFNTGVGRDDAGCTPEEVPIYSKVGSADISRDNLIMGLTLLPNFLRTPAGMSFAIATGVEAAALFQADMENISPAQADAYLQLMEMIYLASDEAERLGFKIGDKELAKAMYPESFFKLEEPKSTADGDPIQLDAEPKKVFDQKSFTNWVTYGLHASPQEYEDFVRRILLAFRLQSYLAGIVKVEPMEAELFARARETKVNLAYVEFRPEAFAKGIAVASEEAAKFAADNQADIAKYYDANPSLFKSDAKYSLAGIFVSPRKDAVAAPQDGKEPADPTAEEIEKAEARAKEMLDRVKGNGPLFKEEAAQPAAEGSAEQAGEATKPPRQDPTDLLERFKEVAKRESDDAESRDRSGLLGGLKSVTELSEGPIGTRAQATLANAQVGDIVGPVLGGTPTGGPEGFWLLYVIEKVPAKDLSLADATLEIATILLREKKAPEVAKTKAQQFIELAKNTENNDLEKAAEEFNKTLTGDKGEAEVDTPILLARKSGKFALSTPGYSVPGIGEFEELFKQGFKMKLDAPLAQEPFVHPETGRVYVIKLEERVIPDKALPEDALATEKENLSFARDIPYFASWLKTLRQTAIDQGKMERTEEFQAFLAYLQTQIEQREMQAARQSAEGKTPQE